MERDYESRLYSDMRFSEDINRGMQVPDRLGASGSAMESTSARGFSGFGSNLLSLSEKDPDLMHVPDKILVTGQTMTPAKEYLDPLDPTLMISVNDVISIDSPPPTITLDEMQYPDIDVEDDAPTASSRRKRSLNRMPGGDSRISSSSECDALTPSLANLASNLSKLQRRLNRLEAESEQRRKLDMVIYPAVGLYFFMKLFSWLFRSRGPAL